MCFRKPEDDIHKSSIQTQVGGVKRLILCSTCHIFCDTIPILCESGIL